MNHKLLIDYAIRWLRSTERCPIVISELVSSAGETPDAIGWTGSKSVLVECKISLSDFRADKWKPWRRASDIALGDARYYLVAPDIAKQVEAELPDGWGLLVAKGNGCHVLKKSGYFQTDKRKEILILVSTIRRLGASAPALQGVGIKTYHHDIAPKDPVAELHLEANP